jgi:hypothetical protein
MEFSMCFPMMPGDCTGIEADELFAKPPSIRKLEVSGRQVPRESDIRTVIRGEVPYSGVFLLGGKSPHLFRRVLESERSLIFSIKIFVCISRCGIRRYTCSFGCARQRRQLAKRGLF